MSCKLGRKWWGGSSGTYSRQQELDDRALEGAVQRGDEPKFPPRWWRIHRIVVCRPWWPLTKGCRRNNHLCSREQSVSAYPRRADVPIVRSPILSNRDRTLGRWKRAWGTYEGHAQSGLHGIDVERVSRRVGARVQPREPLIDHSARIVPDHLVVSLCVIPISSAFSSSSSAEYAPHL